MNNITVQELIDNIDNYTIVDLRSPKEYSEGTIKHAVNIPLLDDDARSYIGTLYSKDKEQAYKEGLKIGTEKLPSIHEQLINLKQENKEIVLFCYKGGTRSSSIQAVMELLKFKTKKLEGGYKNYRTYIIEQTKTYLENINLHVLTGFTGSGKTNILENLSNKNYPTLDLEGLCNHRGSVFGKVGLKAEITQKTFEDKMFYVLKNYHDKNIKNIFIESESRKIGSISLTNELYNKMQTSNHILVDVNVKKRVDIISDMYDINNIDKQKIIDIIKNNDHFKTLLGQSWVNESIKNIEEEKYKVFIERMLLDYYDKLYDKSHINYDYKIKIQSDDLDEITNKLISYYEEEKRANGQ